MIYNIIRTVVTTYFKGIHKLVEGKAVVLAWLGNVTVAAQPELLVLQDNLLEVFESNDNWVHFAQLTKFEELNR
jgi:hypothetical protein